MTEFDVLQPIDLAPYKFKRRKDLTYENRLYISFMALIFGSWGQITKLAKDYAISRTFVYTLQSQLYSATISAFGDSHNQIELVGTGQDNKKKAIECTLFLRLTGKCSIPATSEIMKRLGVPFSSVGGISQILSQIGSGLSGNIEPQDGQELYVYLASDEVYSHSSPILVSVDPISTAILKIELAESRKTDTWIGHFNQLKNSGLNIVKVVSDEGIGLSCAANGLNIDRQPDTFHAISHRLGKWAESLKNSAFAKIKEEYHLAQIFESGKSEKVLQERLDAYFKAHKESQAAIGLYDNFCFLYNCILEKLNVFDNFGKPNNREDAQETIKIALDFMVGFPVKKLQKSVNTIYNTMDSLLDYMDVAQKVLYELRMSSIPEYILNLFSLAWQCEKNQIKAKNIARNKFYKTKKLNTTALLEAILKNEFDKTKELVYSKLDTIIQSSSIVENINSIVRSYLNTSRNHIQQSMLNLIMFYHNHRRYIAGKRKGKTPMELLTGKKQEKDWIELLFQTVNIDEILKQTV